RGGVVRRAPRLSFQAGPRRDNARGTDYHGSRFVERLSPFAVEEPHPMDSPSPSTESPAARRPIRPLDPRVVEQIAAGEVIARTRGTTVTVRHLFAHLPARLKFMRNARTESAQVSAIVRRYALVYPERAFRLTLDGHLSFATGGGGRLADALADVYGREIARLLLPFEAPLDGGRISGVIGAPQLNRPSRRQVAFFVNRRWALPQGIPEALEAAYRPYFPRGRHPLAAIFIELPPDAVDVNVHPTKAEVKLLPAAEV